MAVNEINSREIGPVGPQGPMGPQGERGPQGPKGDVGPRGNDGFPGMQGPQGDVGPRGPKGEQGPQGIKGDQGEPGPRGERGERGEKGETGTVRWDESHPLTPEQILALRGEKGDKGDVGERGPRGHDGFHGAEGAKGEKGDKGEQGPEGIQGPRGPQGAEGPQGPPGPQGPRGVQGVPGNVKFTELNEEQRESLRGPRGYRGEQGPVGDRGERGADGNGAVTEHVGSRTTWSSKDIIDHSLYGKVNWEPRTIHNGGVENTENGYARDLKVLGKTVTNYANMVPIEGMDESEILRVNALEELKYGHHKIYEKPKSGRPTIELDRDYTVTFKTNIEQLNPDPYYAVVTVGDPTMPNEKHFVQKQKLKNGINSINFRTLTKDPGTAMPTEIFIKFISKDGSGNTEEPGEGETESLQGVNFEVYEVMILGGDRTGHVIPKYFKGTKGIGNRGTDGFYAINIESRNKNLINIDPESEELITDYYIHNDSGAYRWTLDSNNQSITYLINVRPGVEYAFKARFSHDYEHENQEYVKEKKWFKILEFKDTPTNGDDGIKNVTQHGGYDNSQDKDLSGGHVSFKFKTSSDTNLIGIYVCNAKKRDRHEDGHTESYPTIYKVDEIFEELQLEEGVISTSYEPYKKITKTIRLPQQLMEHETLMWDKNAGRYSVYDDLGNVKYTTNETEEVFLHTFKNMTYIYVPTKLSPVIEARFPILDEHNDTYSRIEWGFRGDDPLPGVSPNPDIENFLRLPNGCLMQWKKFRGIHRHESPQTNIKVFANAKKIIYASANLIHTGADSSGQDTDFVILKTQIMGSNGVKVWADDNANNAEYTVFIISDNREDTV